VSDGSTVYRLLLLMLIHQQLKTWCKPTRGPPFFVVPLRAFLLSRNIVWPIHTVHQCKNARSYYQTIAP
jgi:hypothetical protein